MPSGTNSKTGIKRKNIAFPLIGRRWHEVPDEGYTTYEKTVS